MKHKKAKNTYGFVLPGLMSRGSLNEMYCIWSGQTDRQVVVLRPDGTIKITSRGGEEHTIKSEDVNNVSLETEFDRSDAVGISSQVITVLVDFIFELLDNAKDCY